MDSLRIRVVQLAELAASLPGISSNDMECRKVDAFLYLTWQYRVCLH